jgi:threonine/homoserine efflux transporter RhtA
MADPADRPERMPRPGRRSASWLVVGAVASVQSGQALGKSLFDAVEPAGVVTLRLGLAALVLLAVWRPRPPTDPRDVRLVAALGTAIAGMNLIYPALAHLPVGVAVSLQYLGPLTVALADARRARDLAWAALAGAGVLAFYGPAGPMSLVGAVLALLSGGSMGAYLLLNQRAGARTRDGSMLAWAVAWAALLSAPTGAVPAAEALARPGAPGTLAVAGAVAVLSAVVPYSLDLAALRLLPSRVVAVVESLEPVAGGAAGILLLGEALAASQWLAIGCIALASAGAALTGTTPACTTRSTGVRRSVSAKPPAEDLRTVDDFDELVRLVTEREHLYVRYSQGPAHDGDGPSHDYEAGVDMPGLSVTPIAPEPWWPRPAEEWVARRLCKYEELGEEHGRFPWLLHGHVAGYGPDHEPLVVDVEPVARVGSRAVNRARQLYEERFEVAQDSRA